MARKKSLIIEILGKNKLSSAVRSAMGSLRKLGKFARGVGRGIAKGFKIGTAAIAGMVAASIGLIKLYSTQEAAEKDVAAAILGRGEALDVLLPKLKADAIAIQRETVFGDEFVLSLMAQAIAMGVESDMATKATRAALGLAKAYGIEQAGALRLVARARVGDTAQLKRYGITLDDTLSPMEKFLALLKIGQKNFALVRAETETTRGRFLQFKNAMGDVGEGIGGAIVKGTGLAGVLESLTKRSTSMSEVVEKKLLPSIRKATELMKGLFGGDTAARQESIKQLQSMFADAGTFIKPKFMEWGEAAGRAIWQGFINGGKHTAAAIGSAAAAKGRTGLSRFSPMAGLSALQDVSTAAGSFAGNLGPSMQHGNLIGPIIAAAKAYDSMQAGRAGSTASTPVYVQEVKPGGVTK